MPLWSPYPSKPPLGVTIDWSRPLTKGLLGVWALNEGAGLPREGVTGTQTTLLSGTSASWTSSRFGAGIASALGAGPAYGLVYPNQVDVAKDFTVLVLVQFSAFQVSSPFISGLWSASNNDRLFMRLGDGSLSPNQFQMSYWSNKAQESSGSFVADTPYVVAMTVSSPDGIGNITQSGYANGKLLCSQTGLYSAITLGSSRLYCDDTDPAGRCPAATCGLVAIWARGLSATEVASIATPESVWGALYGQPRAYRLYRAAVAASPIKARRSFGSERAGSRGVA